MNNNQHITVLSVNLCDPCISVLEKIIFNTENTQNTEYHREQELIFNRYQSFYFNYFICLNK